MRKLLGYVFTPLFILVFVLILIIFHPIQWICLRFFGYKAHKRSVDILNGCITGSYVILGTIPTFINKQQLPLGHPIIFVANHQSLHDIPGMIWFLRKYHAKFISKVELTKSIPSISFNLKYGGGANIKREDAKQSVMEILKLGRRMKENNWSTIIFAEGTRSKDGTVRHFQAAGIATLLKGAPNALVVPVAIENSWKMNQYGMYPQSFGEKLRWTVLPPIDKGGKNVDQIVLEAENAIRDFVSKT